MQIVRHIGHAPPPPPRSAGIQQRCILLCLTLLCLVEGWLPGPAGCLVRQVARLAPAQATSSGVLVSCCSERSPDAQLDPALQQWLAETQGTFSTILQELQAWHQLRGEPAPVYLAASFHRPATSQCHGCCVRLGTWSEHLSGMHKLLGSYLCFTLPLRLNQGHSLALQPWV